VRLILARLARSWAALVRLRTLPLATRLFAGCRRGTLLPVRFAGYRLFVDVGRSSTEQLLWLIGERMVAERHLIAGLCQPAMRVADVGANLGYYTLLFAHAVGPTGRIDGFEPEPDNLVTLQLNVRENRLDQVRVHPVAVGDVDGTVGLSPGLNGVVTKGGTIEVQVRRLDSVIEPPLDLLKIDIEGYEGYALRGAEALLRAERPNLFVELHPALLAAPDTIGGLVEWLRGFYPNLEFWEPTPVHGFLDLLASRYLPNRGVQRIHDEGALLSSCARHKREQPFWAVGRSRDSRPLR
jgi:FkbM family methyltransferase